MHRGIQTTLDAVRAGHFVRNRERKFALLRNVENGKGAVLGGALHPASRQKNQLRQVSPSASRTAAIDSSLEPKWC
ncbi:hypothetical protein GCM10023209_04930 [Roseibacterium beibuensis]|uniref:Uncharacterized protein n=1 Tax=[Roseibacterium] beibuensis TaxID=1193142 RepID=A0ABP9KYL8_9RHOB